MVQSRVVFAVIFLFKGLRFPKHVCLYAVKKVEHCGTLSGRKMVVGFSPHVAQFTVHLCPTARTHNFLAKQDLVPPNVLRRSEKAPGGLIAQKQHTVSI